VAAIRITKVKRKPKYTAEQKQAWKEERMKEQREMLENALRTLSTSDMWANWIKFGRSNLAKYSFNNALLIFMQKQDASRVAGYKQWEKLKVKVNADARPIKILAPCFVKMRDQEGNVLHGPDGKPLTRVGFYKTVAVFDISDTDAPKPERPDYTLEGDELMKFHTRLEQFAMDIGYHVVYKTKAEDHLLAKGATGYVNERMLQIVMDKDASGNTLVHTLVHELCHAYGNVNYKDYSRAEAEVLVESATVMSLAMVGFDVSDAAVPYIAAWGGDLKVLDTYAKLVEELVNKLTEKMGL
jgi:hypothetical protein